jgi:hypothetical protein
MQYKLATDVQKIAKRLIREDHHDLASKDIRFIFKLNKDKNDQSVPMKSKGRAMVATTKIVGGEMAFLISGEETTDANGPSPLVLVTVSEYTWNEFTPEQRLAAVDAQLCKLDYDADTGRPSLIDFDVQAHTRNVKKYGAWNRDLNYFFEAAKQAPLFEGLPEIAEAAVTQSTEQAASAPAGNGVKIQKPGNGATEKAEPKAQPTGNGIREMKAEVLRRKGGAARATK